MEGLNSILHNRATGNQFTFHTKCKALQIHHIAFADDLFVLCGANQVTCTTVKTALDDYYSFSGLRPNLQKSAVFYSGAGSDLKEELETILPLHQASLPVRYLGVHLITSRLSHTDCMQLKDKIIQGLEAGQLNSCLLGVGLS